MFTADAHCDTLYSIAVTGVRADHLSVTRERLRAGNVALQTFALFCGTHADAGTPPSRAEAMLNAAAALDVPILTGALPSDPPCTPHGVLSIEGGEVLEGKLERLHAFARAGVRMIALTWNYENEIGFPCTGDARRGLTPFGRELLSEMGRLGVLADVSHLNDAGIDEVLAHSALPVVASHSNLRAVTDVPRNLLREHVRGIVASGGFIGVNFYSKFVTQRAMATMDDVLRHIDGLCELGAEACLGFGSDFDGIELWPEGLANPADFPALLCALQRRGYTPSQIEDIAGRNLWRVYQRAGFC